MSPWFKRSLSGLGTTRSATSTPDAFARRLSPVVRVKVTRFDPTDSLIIIVARISGPHDEKEVSLALDTAATQTHIIPDVVDEIGYSPRHGDQVTSITSSYPAIDRGFLVSASVVHGSSSMASAGSHQPATLSGTASNGSIRASVSSL